MIEFELTSKACELLGTCGDDSYHLYAVTPEVAKQMIARFTEILNETPTTGRHTNGRAISATAAIQRIRKALGLKGNIYADHPGK